MCGHDELRNHSLFDVKRQDGVGYGKCMFIQKDGSVSGARVNISFCL